MAAASFEILRRGNGLTFQYDEWEFVMNRRGNTVDVFLQPHGEHLSIVLVAVYKLLFATAGLSSYWTYRSTLLLIHLVIVALVFVLARRRVGDPLALAAATLVLFLGTAWEDLLWPFQLGYLLSLAAGLGMLLALERRDVFGDVGAAALLAIALGSSSVGLPVAALALVDIPFSRGDRAALWSSARRLWIAGIPIALYILWFAFYGNTSATPGSTHGFALVRENAPVIPQFAADMAASTFGGMTGLGFEWGRSLAAAAAIALGIWFASRRAVSARALALLAGLAAFWVLTALFRAQLYEPTASRYIYPGAVLVLLLAAELIGRRKASLRAGAVVAGILLAAMLGNYSALRGGSFQLRDWSRYVRAELGALEIVGPLAPKEFAPDPMRAPDVTAGPYLAAVKQLGSPADRPEEIRRRAEPEREAADGILFATLRLRLEPARRASIDRSVRLLVEGAEDAVTVAEPGCLSVRPATTAGNLTITMPPHGLVISNASSAGVDVRLRSFADIFAQASLTNAPPQATSMLRMPSRTRRIAWHAELALLGPVRVCALGKGSS